MALSPLNRSSGLCACCWTFFVSVRSCAMENTPSLVARLHNRWLFFRLPGCSMGRRIAQPLTLRHRDEVGKNTEKLNCLVVKRVHLPIPSAILHKRLMPFCMRHRTMPKPYQWWRNPLSASRLPTPPRCSTLNCQATLSSRCGVKTTRVSTRWHRTFHRKIKKTEKCASSRIKLKLL